MIGLFTDISGKQPFGDMGEVRIGTSKEIQVFMVASKEEGRKILSYRNISIESGSGDVVVESELPKELEPEEAVHVSLKWTPQNKKGSGLVVKAEEVEEVKYED